MNVVSYLDFIQMWQQQSKRAQASGLWMSVEPLLKVLLNWRHFSEIMVHADIMVL